MKPITFIFILCGFALLPSCTKSEGATVSSPQPSALITVAQANRQIQSYLTSIGYPQNNTEVRSWLIDADGMRKLLSDTAIKKVKILVGHAQGYIDDGNEGKPPHAGVDPRTVILTGVDGKNNYRTFNGYAMDNAAPCPRMCLTDGSAAQDLITIEN